MSGDSGACTFDTYPQATFSSLQADDENLVLESENSFYLCQSAAMFILYGFNTIFFFCSWQVMQIRCKSAVCQCRTRVSESDTDGVFFRSHLQLCTYDTIKYQLQIGFQPKAKRTQAELSCGSIYYCLTGQFGGNWRKQKALPLWTSCPQ